MQKPVLGFKNQTPILLLRFSFSNDQVGLCIPTPTTQLLAARIFLLAIILAARILRQSILEDYVTRICPPLQEFRLRDYHFHSDVAVIWKQFLGESLLTTIRIPAKDSPNWHHQLRKIDAVVVKVMSARLMDTDKHCQR